MIDRKVDIFHTQDTEDITGSANSLKIHLCFFVVVVSLPAFK